MQFYICRHCGTIVSMIHKGGCLPSCCGKEMQELKANTTDAAQEKHVPVITVKGSEVHVAVGSVIHPIEADHYIRSEEHTSELVTRSSRMPSSA